VFHDSSIEGVLMLSNSQKDIHNPSWKAAMSGKSTKISAILVNGKQDVLYVYCTSQCARDFASVCLRAINVLAVSQVRNTAISGTGTMRGSGARE
jgi:hypothetical protein